MKKKLFILLIAQLFVLNSFSQKTVYFLSEKMNVGCYGANPLTDFTKKITITFNGDHALLNYGSVNCKFEKDCSNFGPLSSSKSGILYIDKKFDIGFIAESNDKVIILRKEDKMYEIIAVAHTDKAAAGSYSVADETKNYQNELRDFTSILDNLTKAQKMRELNKLAAADSASTFLDGQEILKDSRGMSGIYYSTFPIKINFSLSGNNPPPYAKKFLVNYDESSKVPMLYINTQYAYETTDRTKFVKRASFWLDEKYWQMVLKETGVFATSEADNVDNSKYEFYTHSESKDLQGNSIYGKDWLTNFDGQIYEAEPGILLIVGKMQDTQSFQKDISYAKKYGVVAILYKAEKASEVARYTNDYAWDKIQELNSKIKSAGNAASGKLPVETFKDAKINAEALEFAKSYAAKNHPNEQVLYTYIAGNDWNIIRDKNSGAITKRTLRIIVVVKIGNQCAFENAYITQNYDGSSYGRSIYGGSGAPVYFDCKDVNLYR